MESGENLEAVWYKNASYTEKIELAREKLSNMVGSFVEAGYWIRSIWEDEECKKHGYSTIWEMAEAEFGLKKSEASRAINMNKKYSVGGNSPIILEKYSMYSKSQLQEMLTIKSEELEQKVTADMTVEEIRQLKKTGATVEELEMLREVLVHYAQGAYAEIFKVSRELGGEISEIIKEKLEWDVPVKYGNKVFFTGDDKDELVERVTGEVLAAYAPDIAVKMILEEYQKLHEIKQVKKKPDIRGLCDDAYCSECGCSLNEPDSGLEISFVCPECGQAVDWSSYEGEKEPAEPVNTESDRVLGEEPATEPVATSQEPVNTESEVLLETEIIEEIEAEEEEITEFLNFEIVDIEQGEENEEVTIIDGAFREISEVEESETAEVENSELTNIKKILETEKMLLDSYLEFDDLPESTLVRQKIIVGALANMLCELEETEEKEIVEQPELAILKNNDQRKEFIDGYMEWPVWIEQPLTGERYYRYEFENGTAFVVRVYFHKCFEITSSYNKKWEDRYKDDWGAEEYYIVTEGKHFKDCLTNKSQMIEFLKNLQKGEK